ncbi:als operon DNA-binding transcriptional repressor AlsR [Georgenia halophila]|uniref:Als operon DNA-binding transcriptional repressor AlsR n=1 Tax=Georgenia halophila TaxID=620889 RepID=A0ABP8LJJ7_9MICO
MRPLSSLSLRHLEYFCAVVEAGSISDAAQRLHVSPGGISTALTQLEARLDVQLTVRTPGRGVMITPTGRRVYESARAVAADIEDIQHAAAMMRGELTGTFHVGFFSTLSPWLFPKIAEHFATQFPGVDLQLEESGSETLQTHLLEGNLDAALLYENHLIGGIDAHPLLPVRLQLAVSPSHPLARYEAVPLSLLRDEPAVILSMRPATDHVEAILREAGMRPNVRWRSANVETIRSLVARGLGYTIIMGRPYGDTTYEGMPIVYRPIADEIPPNSLVLATAGGSRPTAKLKELRAFCENTFGDVAAHLAPAHQSRMGHLS